MDAPGRGVVKTLESHSPDRVGRYAQIAGGFEKRESTTGGVAFGV